MPINSTIMHDLTLYVYYNYKNIIQTQERKSD